MSVLTLPQGSINERDTGSGPPIVFVHGSARRRHCSGARVACRCSPPTSTAASGPTGRSARTRTADATPTPTCLPRGRRAPDRGCARGARARRRHARRQRHRRRDLPAAGDSSGRERIGRLVLTNCDCVEELPAQGVQSRWCGWRASPCLLNRVRPPADAVGGDARRNPTAYGMLTRKPIPAQVTGAWVRPFLSDRAIRRDTVEAAARRRPGRLRSRRPSA